MATKSGSVSADDIRTCAEDYLSPEACAATCARGVEEIPRIIRGIPG
jgi:hypothetical protein